MKAIFANPKTTLIGLIALLLLCVLSYTLYLGRISAHDFGIALSVVSTFLTFILGIFSKDAKSSPAADPLAVLENKIPAIKEIPLPPTEKTAEYRPEPEPVANSNISEPVR